LIWKERAGSTITEFRVAPTVASTHIRSMSLPRWVEPQLSKLVEKAPTGPQRVHEIKFDGYRMAARIERGKVQLLTRSGLDCRSSTLIS
jgi:ATP-dependent DNA ligase